LGLAIAAAVWFAVAWPCLEVDDSGTYLTPARSWSAGCGLVESGGRPLEYRLPAYPLALGVCILLFGDVPVVFSLLNVLCHVAAVLVVRCVVARRDRGLASVVSAVAVVYPPLLTSTGMVLQESLLSLLIALVFLAWWRAVERPGALRSLGAGAALGLAGLGKATALPFVLPAAAMVAWARPRSIGRGALVLAGAVLTVAPWALRNWAVLGRLEVTNNNAGIAVLGGTVSNRVEHWSRVPEILEARARWQAGERNRYPVLDRYLWRVALDRIKADPLRWLKLAAERTLLFMLPARHWFFQTGQSEPARLGPWYLSGVAAQGVLYAAAAWLTVRTLRSRGPATHLVGPILVFGHQALYAATYASPRYGVTVGPVLFGVLVLALCEYRSPTSSPLPLQERPTAGSPRSPRR
jgi:hypothetical protein